MLFLVDVPYAAYRSQNLIKAFKACSLKRQLLLIGGRRDRIKIAGYMPINEVVKYISFAMH
jgi:hypothetical protein